MYHPMSIAPLSKKQVSKLLNAHPVRVKSGSGAKIHVSAEQAKKLQRAGLKGCAITLTLDPYAIEHNQHLRDAVGMLRKAGILKGGTALIDQEFTTREAVNTIGNFVKNPAKTLGFGATKVQRRAKRCCKGKGIPEILIAQAMGYGFEGPLPSPDRRPPLPYQKRMKGDGFWEDVGTVAKKAGKTAVKALANEVVQYAGPAAASAFAAAATATGNPEFAPAAALIGNELGTRAGRYANKRIQGMGRGGRILIDEPITTRQIVNTTGDFFKNPSKTLGFGAKRKGKGFVEDIANFGNKLKPVLDVLKPQYNDLGVGNSVAKSLGMGVKKPKRVMSEAQKAALAKGRHALRIRLNEMGAGAKSGKSLRPAGY